MGIMYIPLAFYHSCSVAMTTELTISLISLRKDTCFCTSELGLGLRPPFRVSGQRVYLLRTPGVCPWLCGIFTAKLCVFEIKRLSAPWVWLLSAVPSGEMGFSPRTCGGRRGRESPHRTRRLSQEEAPVCCHFVGARVVSRWHCKYLSNPAWKWAPAAAW